MRSYTKKIKDFMVTNIISASEDTSVYKLCSMMAKKNISCVVIMSEKTPSGIVTERDIVTKALTSAVSVKKTPASRIMSKPVLTIDQNADIAFALALMNSRKVRRLIVVNANKVKGIATQTDVLNGLQHLLLEKFQEINSMYNKSQQFFKDSVNALCKALDAKDHYTGRHSKEVAILSKAICQKLGFDEETKRKIYLAALFHDIGKIHVQDSILNKPGRLDDNEMEEIRRHSMISEMILRPIIEFKDLLKIIRYHHEWYNGTGYPQGLKGEKIPIGARIIAVCDNYNAMRTRRPYRGPMSSKKAIFIIKEMAGIQFDPKIVDVFLRLVRQNNGKRYY